ncbi:hypothetical protein H0194_05830 [Corynebacterium incognita]|uniref:Uncharacterized protein n=1 Tax=Corynebacterium incognita TaxID=2754725 RepID=A0A7G7CM21_9CORY|nr:hypothetical protein [Corynebacterium incognita]QNE88637.1 hypothetical protein H0194_05830 [Corynebacterium incognita]
MNPTTLKATYNVAASLWNRFNEYRAEKAQEAYSALAGAVETVDDDMFPATRREAGALTRAAHARLEKQKEELPPKKKKNYWLPALLIAAGAAIGGAFYFFKKREEPLEEPPRTDDFEGSTLVYTSTTEDDLLERQAASDPEYPDMVEEPVTERDEELLGSIDEQLEAHRKGPKHALDED